MYSIRLRYFSFAHTRWSQKRFCCLLILLTTHEVLSVSSLAQNASQTKSVNQNTSIHGVVLNGSTNLPLARALVQVDGHSALTGSDGKFEFSGVGGTSVSVRVTKPGFYDGFGPSPLATKSIAAGAPNEAQVKLYPEALITGTLSSGDGVLLAQISVQALRRVNDESGPRWVASGNAITNADGEFRMPLPGGDYVVQTQYSPERFGLHGAVLPISIPAAGASGGSTGGAAPIRLASGSEQHLDLHAPVRSSHAVHIQIDSSSSTSPEQNPVHIQAHLANGTVFSPGSRGAGRTGEEVVNLPNGSYLLSATTGGREDAASYGETRITVADEDVTGVAIHLQKAVQLTIEVSTEPSAMATAPELGNPSFAQQLGIFLQRTNAGFGLGVENVYASSRPGAAPVFSLLPGSYRLRTSGSSSWFIQSADAGGTNLLAEDLVVGSGESSMPLRIAVNNQTATIKGSTRLGEQIAKGYIYIFATGPSTAPVITSESGEDGSFARALIAPGSYRVVASETRLFLDLYDPTVQQKLAPYTQTVTVAEGAAGSVMLDIVPSSELKP